MNEIAIVGTGAWGTALAVQAARAGADVVLCGRDRDRVAAIAATRENSRLPGIRLPDTIRLAVMPACSAEMVFLVVPIQYLRATASLLPAGTAPLIACCKGLEQSSGALPLEILAATQPGRRAGLLTGPNLAGEIALGRPAATVIASTDAPLRARFAELLGTSTFRIYGNDDPVGAGVGGAAKNVIAIAAGAVIGAGLGENARAALITRGLAEIGRLAVGLGGRAETIAGLSGLGDLVLTCTSTTSRNFSFGAALGAGATVDQAFSRVRGVVEGAPTATPLVARARKLGLELPISEAVAELVSGRTTLAEAIAALMARRLRDE